MFVPGAVMQRAAMHGEFRGQRFGGISTLARHPMVWLFSGEHGEQYGYKDGFTDEGIYWYTGEGQVGDMKMHKGNSAIRDHKQLGKTLHLFDSVSKGWVKYLGEATYIDHHHAVRPDRNGDPRRAIVFELAVSYQDDGVALSTPHEPKRVTSRGMWKQPLDALRKLASERAPDDATPAQRKANIYARSAAVRVYVLRRAAGHCEGCRAPAPFSTSRGEPYLEAHHLRRRADGGPDHPSAVIALCPNCHRRVHHGGDGTEYNSALIRRIVEIESSYGGSASTLEPVMNSRGNGRAD